MVRLFPLPTECPNLGMVRDNSMPCGLTSSGGCSMYGNSAVRRFLCNTHGRAHHAACRLAFLRYEQGVDSVARQPDSLLARRIFVTYNFRAGAVVTFMREDGYPGPGEMVKYPANDGWKVEIQNEGCVEISGYGKEPSPATVVIGWNRIYQIESMSW
jgi:hypothetical protein